MVRKCTESSLYVLSMKIMARFYQVSRVSHFGIFICSLYAFARSNLSCLASKVENILHRHISPLLSALASRDSSTYVASTLHGSVSRARIYSPDRRLYSIVHWLSGPHQPAPPSRCYPFDLHERNAARVGIATPSITIQVRSATPPPPSSLRSASARLAAGSAREAPVRVARRALPEPSQREGDDAASSVFHLRKRGPLACSEGPAAKNKGSS